MPQFLIITVEGQPIGRMISGNLGGASYNIRWASRALGVNELFRNVDTGEPAQPREDDPERASDDRCDFKHARRCLAAAAATAEVFLTMLNEGTQYNTDAKPIRMLLKTNQFDRGFIDLLPSGKESVDVELHIGVGNLRLANALPTKEWCRIWKVTDTSGATTHRQRALRVLSSIAKEMRDALPKSC